MGVIVDKPEEYLSQWIPPRSAVMLELEAEARDDDIPIVGPVVGHLLHLLAVASRARRIVELGTATGYSAMFLGSACRTIDGYLTTFETDPGMAVRAGQNIERAGLSKWVRVECQDALDGLRKISTPVDMIFMDIEKEDYAIALPLCGEKLRTNGLLVADNTGFKDAHTFNQMIFESPVWEVVNLWTFLPGHSPVNDGLCIALKSH